MDVAGQFATCALKASGSGEGCLLAYKEKADRADCRYTSSVFGERIMLAQMHADQNYSRPVVSAFSCLSVMESHNTWHSTSVTTVFRCSQLVLDRLVGT